MANIASGTGVNTLRGRIETATSYLVLKKVTPQASGAPFANETVTLEILGGGGLNRTLARSLKATTLSVFGQYGEGANSITVDGENHTHLLFIPVGDGGSFPFNSDIYVNVEVGNLTSSATYEIYGLEFPVMTSGICKYSTNFVHANSSAKSFETHELDLMLVPDNIQSARLFLDNGVSINLTKTEIEAYSLLGNDFESVKVNADGSLEGTRVGDLRPIMLHYHQNNVTRMEITNDSNDSILYTKQTIYV